MIRCPQCGYENALGHIFCIRCRSKLDVQVLDTQAFAGPKSIPRNRRGWRLIWMVVLAGIVVGAALALWPASLAGRKGTEADAQQVHKKILILEKGLSPAAQVFTEREINAYLSLIQHNIVPPPVRNVWTIVMQAAEVTIRPNAVTFSATYLWGPVTVGSIKLGPWNVTSQVTVVPEQGPLGFQWTTKGGRIGHLPLPGPMSAPATSVLRPLLASCVRERALLKTVIRLELEEGQAVVAVKTVPGRAHDQGPRK